MGKGKVFGVGINDADYTVQVNEFCTISKKYKVKWKCQLYSTWVGVLYRCYSEKLHKKRSTYKECTVCEEWLIFSNFKSWMEKQDWKGKQLDKDLLVKGNKLYSPETCVFVKPVVNNFITDSGNTRGEYLIGVSLSKRNGKFAAQCRDPFIKKGVWLGYFDTEISAHLAWRDYKHNLACRLADSNFVDDERVAKALKIRYKEDLYEF